MPELTKGIILEWVDLTVGWWDVTRLDKELDIVSPQGKATRRTIVYRLVKDGYLEKHKYKEGSYRRVEAQATELDWQSADSKAVLDLRFPFGIEDYVKIFPKSIIVVAGASNAGKGHPMGTLVLTPSRWKRIEELKIGDTIYNINGLPIKVLNVFHRNIQPCYSFIFNDGTQIEADSEHIWHILGGYNRLKRYTGHKNANTHYGEWENLTTKEIIGRYGSGKLKGNNRLVVPTNKPVNFPSKKVKLDPYMLGLLLGDGGLTRTTPMISTADREIIDYIKGQGFRVNYASNYDYRILGLSGLIDELGLSDKWSYDKFVPYEYLWNSIDVRQSVLAGLLDTDGNISGKTMAEFSTCSDQLAQDVIFLVRSLGGRAVLSSRIPHFTYKDKRKNGRVSYRVHIKFNDYCPFRLSRKRLLWVKPIKTSNRILYEIRPMGEKATICIQTDDKDGLYIAQDFIVSHNTAFLYNFILMNMERHLIDLYNSETSPEQMKERFENFEQGIPSPAPWRTFERYDCFADIIDPNRVSVIDYIDFNNEVYRVGEEIEMIFRKENKGICIAAIQKKRDTTDYKGKKIHYELGYGSDMSIKKASLYLSMDIGKIKIVKAKSWVDHTLNPNGLEWKFKLAKGCDFIITESPEAQPEESMF